MRCYESLLSEFNLYRLSTYPAPNEGELFTLQHPLFACSFIPTSLLSTHAKLSHPPINEYSRTPLPHGRQSYRYQNSHKPPSPPPPTLQSLTPSLPICPLLITSTILYSIIVSQPRPMSFLPALLRRSAGTIGCFFAQDFGGGHESRDDGDVQLGLKNREARREEEKAMLRKSRYGVLYFQDTSRAQAAIALASKSSVDKNWSLIDHTSPHFSSRSFTRKKQGE